MRNAKGADLAELTSLYLQWRDGENGPVGNDLQIAAWKFTTRHAGDDLGHDVYLRVVQALNRLRDRQSAALPENLAAYLYQSCRNAGKDQQRQTWKYIPFSEEHIPKVRDPFNFVEHRGHSESAPKEWLAIFERCRKSLPTPIAEALNLDSFDILATLDATSNGAGSIKKRIQRARTKCLLTLGASALIGCPTPLPLSTLISRLSPSLRGGPWEKILAMAPRFRDFGSSRAPATTLVEAAQHRLATFVRGQEGIEAFKDSYIWLRTAVLLSPEVAAVAYRELKSSFHRYTDDYPLAGRLLDRIQALSGDELAAAEGNRFWQQCLAVLGGKAECLSETEAFFGAVYVIAYYAEPWLGWPLFRLLQPFNRRRIEQFLKDNADKLRDSMIAQARANVAEGIYQAGAHAEANFVRVQLGLSCLSRCSPRFGKGYARLTPAMAMDLALIAEHAARTATNNRQLKQMAEKIRGSLIYTYDLKCRKFSRLRRLALRDSLSGER